MLIRATGSSHTLETCRIDVEHFFGRLEECISNNNSSQQDHHLQSLHVLHLDSMHVWLVQGKLFPLPKHSDSDIWFLALLAICRLSS